MGTNRRSKIFESLELFGVLCFSIALIIFVSFNPPSTYADIAVGKDWIGLFPVVAPYTYPYVEPYPGGNTIQGYFNGNDNPTQSIIGQVYLSSLNSSWLSGAIAQSFPSATPGAYEFRMMVNDYNNIWRYSDGTNWYYATSQTLWNNIPLTATNGPCDVSYNPTVTVSWGPLVGVNSLSIYRSTGGGSPTLIYTGAPPVQNYTDDPASPGQLAFNTTYTYTMSVRALNGQTISNTDSVAPTATVTTSGCISPPTISALKVGNATSPSWSGPTNSSGLTVAEGGVNWLNPLKIELDAAAHGQLSSGSPNTLVSYIVAFYDQSLNGGVPQTSLAGVLNLIDANPANGFAIQYQPNNPNPYSIRSAGAWQYIDTSGFPPKTSKTIGSLYTLYIPSFYSLPNPYSWGVKMYKAFASKKFYTAGFATDQQSQTVFQGDITPTYWP